MKNRKEIFMEKITISVFAIWMLFISSIAIGWVLNIISLTNITDPFQSTIGILRIVGIFLPPLGAIMGYLY